MPKLDVRAEAALLQHAWPGNLRELRSVIERAVIASDSGIITVSDIHLSVPPSAAHQPPIAPGATPLIPLADVEQRHILGVLAALGGNKKAAAETLGIDRSTSMPS